MMVGRSNAMSCLPRAAMDLGLLVVGTGVCVISLSAYRVWSSGDETAEAGVVVRLLQEAQEVLLPSTNFHKDLFPMDSSDVWGTILVTLGLMIAASGGIGGGGMLVPLYILVMGFHPKNAIALSNFTIVGSSVTNIIMNLSKRHPDADRPLVDWDLILVMEPLTMAGAISGAFASKLLPDWLLTIMLVILLAFTTYETLKKGLSQFTKETRAFEDQRKSILRQTEESELELVAMAESVGLLKGGRSGDGGGGEEEGEDGEGAEETGGKRGSASTATTPEERELAELLETERYTPQDKAVLLSGMVLAVVVLNLLKGGGATFPSPLGFACGSAAYWSVQALVLVIVLGVSVHMRSVLIDKWRLKQRLRYRYVPGDVEWNERNTVVYPCICFFAGIFAGMFGVGGGIVKGPLMLQMGVHPLVTSATVAVMIMFTSVAATAMFMAFGTLKWDYAAYFFVVGLAATAVGQYGVSYLVEKYKRNSLVTLSIGAVVLISTLLMGLQSIFSIIDAEENAQPSATICS